jgi:hypothetical protein
MPELIRTFANRLRSYMGNRRRAPRYAAHLEVGLALSVSMPSAKISAEQAERMGRSLKLAGYTRDISATGLALIVPSIRIGGQYITGENRALQIMLKLPTGSILIHGTPVRYSPLEAEEEEGSDNGYIIGVSITDMSDEDRARFNAYIESVKAEG